MHSLDQADPCHARKVHACGLQLGRRVADVEELLIPLAVCARLAFLLVPHVNEEAGQGVEEGAGVGVPACSTGTHLGRLPKDQCLLLPSPMQGESSRMQRGLACNLVISKGITFKIIHVDGKGSMCMGACQHFAAGSPPLQGG